MITPIFPLHVDDRAAVDLNVLAFEDVVLLADADFLVAYLGGHHLAGGRLGGGGEVERHMLRVLHPLSVGAQHVVGLLFHALDLAADQFAGGHEGRRKMRLAGLIQLYRHALGLDHIGHLGHGRLAAFLAAAVHQLHAGKCGHRQDQHHGDHIDDVKLSNALCFLFHTFLHKRRGRPILSRQCLRNIV